MPPAASVRSSMYAKLSDERSSSAQLERLAGDAGHDRRVVFGEAALQASAECCVEAFGEALSQFGAQLDAIAVADVVAVVVVRRRCREHDPRRRVAESEFVSVERGAAQTQHVEAVEP